MPSPAEEIAETEALAGRLLDRARRAGAEAADVLAVTATDLSVTRRLDRPELLERAEHWDIGLRVFVGARSANVSTSDIRAETLDLLAERAVAMARAVPEDPYSGLAPAERLAVALPELDMVDPHEPDEAALIERARAAEAAALAVPGVTNSDGASASWFRRTVCLATSHGFRRGYATTRTGVSVSVIAGSGTAMETDHDWATAVHGPDLASAAAVGRRAGERAVRRLGARKLPTGRRTVVFDPRVAAGLLNLLAGAASGTLIARGTSFLKDRLGEAVFAPGIRILDDPHRRRGLRSKPFDGEGVAGRRLELVADGRLASWLLDQRTAARLGLETTGHASRGTGGPPGPAPTNLWLEPGGESPEALIAGVADGLYVTGMMGSAVSLITGDYSRGAHGIRIENGALTHPVSEVTVAGTLQDIFARLVPANDLAFRYGVDAPTLLVEGLTVAGR